MRYLNCFLVFFLLYLTERVNAIEADEFCKVADVNNEVVVPIGLTDSQTNATQNECVKYYQIDLSSKLPSSRFLKFQISFITKPTNENLLPFLIQQTNKKPEVDAGGSIDSNNTISDMNGYVNHKSYYYIVVDIETLPSNASLYFAVYQFSGNKTNYQPEQMIYNITTEVSTVYPCPAGCSGNDQGICSQELKQCNCSQAFFDLDCSVSGTNIPYEGSTSQVINPDKWTYFYVEAKDYGGNLKLAVGKNEGPLYLMFLFTEVSDFSLPNFFEYDGRTYLKFDSLEQVLRLPHSGFRSHIGGRLMIGAYNSGTNDINLQLTVSFYEQEESPRNAIMFVMIGIACGLIFLWIVFSLLKYRAYRQAALIRRQHEVTHQRSLLAKEEVDKYFPIKNFSQWTTSFPQTLCSICLDDFQPDTLCRQLYCEHIFHGPCIEAWFANHINCPNCKKDITREDAEEHLKNPNKPKPEQKSPDIEGGNLLNNGNSPNKDVLNISKDILNNVSLDDVKEKQKKGNEIDLELPLSKRNKPGKLDNTQIVLEPITTVVTPNDRSTTQTGIEIKNEIEENKDDKETRQSPQSLHEER